MKKEEFDRFLAEVVGLEMETLEQCEAFRDRISTLRLQFLKAIPNLTLAQVIRGKAAFETLEETREDRVSSRWLSRQTRGKRKEEA